MVIIIRELGDISVCGRYYSILRISKIAQGRLNCIVFIEIMPKK